GTLHGEEKGLMPALAHQVADAFVHGNPRGNHARGHASDNAVITRRYHVGASAQNRHALEHVVIVGSKDRNAPHFLGDLAAGHGVEAFHSHQDREHAMHLYKGLHSVFVAVDVMLKLPVNIRAGFEEIYRAILAVM